MTSKTLRKRKNKSNNVKQQFEDELVKKVITTKPKQPESIITNSPLYEFLSPFKPVQNQWIIKYIVIIFALIIRIAVSYGPYSGMNTPPMFGDFEAQRHWLDLTINKPIKDWYWYNLEYWGLDYPPLTAYHSLILGYCGKFINPTWFKLDETNGIENDELKFFMRSTVLLSECFCYIPAVYYYTKWFNKNIDILNKKSNINQILCLAILLFQPSLILIDHGHFQYNSVMLGFTLLSLNSFLYDHLLLGCIFFVLALTFKQMALFYAPLIFCYLLGITFNPFNEILNRKHKNKFEILNLFLIGIITLSTFLIIFLPLMIFSDNGLLNLKQSILRIFPFNRGIFEDKVGNFWGTSNIIIKYKEKFSVDFMKLSALLLTVLSILPACLIIYFIPIKSLIPWTLSSCSWGFFLFSFQVHEKSILLPLLPTNLLFCYINDNELFQILSWINNISLFSLNPLLKKDKLDLQYYLLIGLSNWLVGNLNLKVLWNHFELLLKNFFTLNWLLNGIIVITSILATILDLIPYFIEPPANLPDLWVVTNISLSFGCFFIFYLWITYRCYSLAVEN